MTPDKFHQVQLIFLSFICFISNYSPKVNLFAHLEFSIAFIFFVLIYMPSFLDVHLSIVALDISTSRFVSAFGLISDSSLPRIWFGSSLSNRFQASQLECCQI